MAFILTVCQCHKNTQDWIGPILISLFPLWLSPRCPSCNCGHVLLCLDGLI